MVLFDDTKCANRVPDTVRKKNSPLPRLGQNKRGLLAQNGLFMLRRFFVFFVHNGVMIKVGSLLSGSLFI